MELDFIRKLVKPAKTKIVLLIMDGIGGLPRELDNLTELEAANTPNLDMLAKRAICGLQQPVGPGITPGSGPGHLGVFGYNPVKYQVGRGVLAALGIGFDLQSGDVAARGNFCTIDENGNIMDRRAGRISTEENQELCSLLRNIKIPGVEIFVETVKEHRFLIVLRGEKLSGDLIDTDPQEVGRKPFQPKGSTTESEKTVKLIEQFLEQTRNILADHHPANMVLLRGFSEKPNWPTYEEVFGIKSAAIAAYPMYKGVAKLIGMNVLETGATIEEEFSTLENNWNDYDFFYLHVKKTDSAGEDGNFDRKVSIIEKTDKEIPRLLDLNPDVIIVTGDHSTPSLMKAHSWHPVPTLLFSKNCRPDQVDSFGERACITGGLGPRFPAVDLIPLALANAKRIEKFGA
ncbi:MAG: 2,3-bisphosphoglycerate-independent phosphoglycerate mutase [Candidatus Thermoplasmatota archaeon]|nr:2,3-bisphosphoglycerate-independent phosphoglycerate mutase [Candidatus Thermoplasmatota archaeon]